jgi:hypothetical protein
VKHYLKEERKEAILFHHVDFLFFRNNLHRLDGDGHISCLEIGKWRRTSDGKGISSVIPSLQSHTFGDDESVFGHDLLAFLMTQMGTPNHCICRHRHFITTIHSARSEIAISAPFPPPPGGDKLKKTYAPSTSLYN